MSKGEIWKLEGKGEHGKEKVTKSRLTHFFALPQKQICKRDSSKFGE